MIIKKWKNLVLELDLVLLSIIEVDDLGLKEFVHYDDNDEPKSLHYANMVSLLTKAIQEQQTLIESLTNRIAALEE